VAGALAGGSLGGEDPTGDSLAGAVQD
jgi:hypothetical protein